MLQITLRICCLVYCPLWEGVHVLIYFKFIRGNPGKNNGIFHPLFIPVSIKGCREAEPILADFGLKAGYTLGRLSSYCKANTDKRTAIHSHL